MIDSEALAKSRLLTSLGPHVRDLVAASLVERTVAAGDVVQREAPGIAEAESTRGLTFVLEGAGQMSRGAVDVRSLAPGDHFGELGLLARQPRSSTVTAMTPMRVATLSRASLAELEAVHPQSALRLVRALVAELGAQLDEVTDGYGALLRERSVPRREAVTARCGEGASAVAAVVPTGTRLRALLPTEVGGCLVVAGLIDRRPVSLETPLFADADVAPLTLASWEGRDIYRRSACLVLLEAAQAAVPNVRIAIGPSVTSAQVVAIDGVDGVDERASLIPTLIAAMQTLIDADVPFLEEHWSVDEARTHFREHGWDDAASLLRISRAATVAVVRCGAVVALSQGPLLPSTGSLKPPALVPHARGLLLDFGEEIKRHVDQNVVGAEDAVTVEQKVPRYGGVMANAHRAWLAGMGVTSVGAYNELSIDRQVSDLLRVSEGFHEKSLGQLADRIGERAGDVRIIAVAGPSSSGKTTFIKRLTVQLRINGLNPVGISIDDYYVDREKTVRDARGELDFEALEALSLPLFQSHIARLLAGDAVRTARYDFLAGKSLESGGRELRLGARDVLLIEGIHGLNPRLLGDALGTNARALFRIFLHPAVTLPFDRLSIVAPADVRLLRRIVRDRHTRGHDAASNIVRWPSVRAGERSHIFPFLENADAVFDSSLAYEISVLKVFAERYLLEVPPTHPAFTTAYRLRQLLDQFVSIHPDHVPPTSLLREFIGGSGFEY